MRRRLFENGDIGTAKYSIEEHLLYRRTLHGKGLASDRYNVFMDTHVGLVAGWSGAGSTWAQVTRRLQQCAIPHLVRGRNQFESFLTALPSSGIAVQFVWEAYKPSLQWSSLWDMDIPACKGASENSGMLADYDQFMVDARASRGQDVNVVDVMEWMCNVGSPRHPNTPVLPTHRKCPPSASGVFVAREAARESAVQGFDLCGNREKLSHEKLPTWQAYGCRHLGPCCGDHRCDTVRGEDPWNCPIDCYRVPV